jgi:hypothetical protein
MASWTNAKVPTVPPAMSQWSAWSGRAYCCSSADAASAIVPAEAAKPRELAGSDALATEATEATAVRAVGAAAAAAAVYTEDAMEGTARREVAAPTCGTERRRGRWAQNVGAYVMTIAFLGRQKRPGRCLL